MRITYQIARYYNSRWLWPWMRRTVALWCNTYSVVDPVHKSPGGTTAQFKKGDVILLVFNSPSPDVPQGQAPGHRNVKFGIAPNHIEWSIDMFDYSVQGGMGMGSSTFYYLARLTAKTDGAAIDTFKVYYDWVGSGDPSSRSAWWYLFVPDTPPPVGEHWDYGETVNV